MANVRLQADQLPWVPLCNHVIEVTTWKGRGANGEPILDPTTTRQYRCLIQNTDTSTWNQQGVTDGNPYSAYVLSIPITGPVTDDAVPISNHEQVTIIQPTYLAGTVRRMGTVEHYPDQYGNLHNMRFTFQ